MKFVKKAAAMLLAVMMLAIMMPTSNAMSADNVLKFDENGEFTILLFADSQDNEDLEASTTALMEVGIKKHNPDLVIFLGDNTVASGYENQAKAIDALLKPCVDTNTPFAIVFGNHDQEQGVTKEDLLAIYQSYGCLTYDAVPEMSGCGTCNLPIFSSDGAEVMFNLWLTDSGSQDLDEGKTGYDYVREDQIQWYKDTAAALKEANGGEVVPALNFQHIVPSEIYEALGAAKLPFGLENWTIEGQAYSPIPTPGSFTGLMFESPCPSYSNAGHLDAFLETGDVMGTFVGHDHINSYTTYYETTAITNVPAVGCNSYSKPETRGYGVIELNEKDLSTYNYYVDYYADLATGDYPELLEVEGAESTISYKFGIFFRNLLIALNDILGKISLPFGK